MKITSDCNYFTRVIHDFSKGEVFSKINDYVAGETELYIQSMSSLAVYINIENYDTLKGEKAINKAQLFASPDVSDLTHYNINPRLFLFGVDDSGNRFILPDYESEGSEFFDGEYDENLNRYSINISRYLQKFMNQEIKNDTKLDFYLTSFDMASSAVLNSRRSVIKGTKNSSDNLKIIVSFSSFNE